MMSWPIAWGLHRYPDAMLRGALFHPVQRRDLGGQHPARRAADLGQPAGDRVAGRERGEYLDIGSGADRGGEVGQAPLGQQRVAETGPEREQAGGGSHGGRVVQRGEADLAQLGPLVRRHG
jgi:hypothetical protein